MVTDEQYNIAKLKASISVKKDLETARTHLNGLRSALEDVKIELQGVEELEDKEKYRDFDLIFFEIAQFISEQEQRIGTKRFNFEMKVFNALCEKEKVE